MVRIGGGVTSKSADIRLGDVVVSMPTATSGGVIQYDYGKTLHDGRLQHTGSLNKPPQYLLTAASDLLNGIPSPVLLTYLTILHLYKQQHLYAILQFPWFLIQHQEGLSNCVARAPVSSSSIAGINTST
jgi:hypothetical protein